MQRPGPPVIIGGGGPTRTPRLAARYGSEFNLAFRSLDDAREQFERVRGACRAADRHPGSLVLSVAQTVCCGRDEAEVARRARAIGRQVDDLRQNGLCGTPDEIVAKLATFAGVGASRAYLQILDLNDLEHLSLLGQEVLPHCAAL